MRSRGVRITRLSPGGRFEQAGVQLNDVIVRIEDTPALDLTEQQVFSTLEACGQIGSVRLEIAAGAEVDQIHRKLSGPGADEYLESLVRRRLGAVAED